MAYIPAGSRNNPRVSNMGKHLELSLLASAFVLTDIACFGAEPDSKARPPVNPTVVEATNALPEFLVEEGFKIEMVADDSQVSSPAAMAFDENGRLFVAEMRDYPDRRDQSPHLGRIRLLEDTNGDGKFDQSRVYVDNLTWPSAIACSGGGVFVAATPEVLFFKESGAPGGAADVHKVVFNGLGSGKTPRPDALLNSFTWGPDNRIHVGTAGLGGTLAGVEVPNPSALELGVNDFAFDPRSFTPVTEPGSAQSGMCFDDFGRRFFTELARPVRTSMYDPRYTARNPFFVRAPEVIEVMNPAPIFRYLSAQAGVDPAISRLAPPAGAPTGFGALTTAWTGLARGSVVYRGSLFPADYLGNLFVADPKANVIHRAVLREAGLAVTAARAPNEVSSEFVISRDPLFHPTQIINGPEGALYVADMRNGEDHGRIYRITPRNFRAAHFPVFGQAKTYDLVTMLAQTNGWVRDTAARLLYERHDPACVPLLTTMLNNSRLPVARLQALHSLEGMGALTEPVVLRGLRDPDDHVREHALRLCESLIKSRVAPETLWGQLKSMGGDLSLRVRYQLAFTLGQLQRPDRLPVLAQILKRDFGSPWIETAVFSSLSPGAGEFFSTLAADTRFRNDPAGQECLRRLLTLIGVQGQQEDVTQAVDFIDHNALVDRPMLETRLAFSFLFALADGLHRNRSGLALVDRQGRLRRFFDQALTGAADDTLAPAVRVESIRLLSVGSYTYADVGDLLLLLFGTEQADVVQSAGLTALGRLDDQRISTNLFSRLQLMKPAIRKEAVTAVLGRAGGAAAVMGALDTGQVGPADLSPVQINFLRTHKDPGVSQHATRLFGPFAKQRPGILDQAKAAIQMPGAAARSRPVFTARCAACHRLGSEGRAIGPDLGGAKNRGKEKLLADILAPNLEVAPEYTGYVAETGTLETLVGILTDQSKATVTFAQPDGSQAVWPRAALQVLQPQPWGIMPDGLETGLNVQGLADLLDLLMTTPK